MWATRTAKAMIPIFEITHPHLKHTDLVENDRIWDRLWAFLYKDDVASRLPDFEPKYTRTGLRERLKDVEDWSIFVRFPVISGLQFQPSTILQHDLADVSHLGLPERYAVVQPYTPANRASRRARRDYRQHDWDHAREWLRERDLPGVVLNQGSDPIPEDFVDLSNQTTLCEAVQVLKQGEGYVGIDSCFACLACQLFDEEHLDIMWRNTHYWQERHIYCRPHRTYDFLRCGD